VKKVVLGLAVLGAVALTNGDAGAQLVQLGPDYYPTPSWNQQIPAALRFIVLSQFNNVALLDRETGLVWQRSPDPVVQKATWADALAGCHFLGSVGFPNSPPTGNRLGWRLPSVEELASLVDPTQTNPALPPGHPFQNIQNVLAYWTASTEETNAAGAYAIPFSDGGMEPVLKTDNLFYWCVRGGSGVQNPM
jgi:hypothetical protein